MSSLNLRYLLRFLPVLFVVGIVLVAGLFFQFHRPVWLFALVIPAALLVWIWFRTGRQTAVPYDHSGRKPGIALWVVISSAESFVPVLLTIAIMLLALPTAEGNPIRERKLSNIEFCVDCSGSMTAQFGEGTRYEASMEAINQFVELRKGDAFGLTFFATSVIRWCPLTTDSSAFRCALPFMRPAGSTAQLRTIGGGTRIGMALLDCRRTLLQATSGDRMIILVSDGQSADLMNDQDLEIGRQLYRDNIVVYGIHIGGSDIPSEILNLTHTTGGEAFVSGDPEGLDLIFRRIDSMKPADFEVMDIEKVEWFQPLAITGVSILACWGLCLFGLRYTPW
ncbi:MAG: VWA domain-containing protein [Planctomycetaceae bacterium]|nr:VWA domain-containing protein [Planctomycetaceae bacterium]